MTRRVLLPVLLALLLPAAVPAQEEGQDPELAFVTQLRSRGYADLALEYLEKRLSKDPKYAADLPLEIAQVRLDMASTDPDGAKRIGLFDQARTEFASFVAKYPTHPKVAIAKFQIAQVSAMQGKAQLARALALPDGDDGRADELNRALKMLEAAEKGLEDVAEQLKTDEAKYKSQLERGQLLISQGKTLLTLGKETQVSDLLKKAGGLLETLSDKLEARDPLRPLALAWSGRAFSLNAEPSKANLKFKEARGTGNRAAMRLSDYFEMLALFEDERGLKLEQRQTLVEAGQKWLTTNGQFKNTPEGVGVQYILARQFATLGAEAVNAQTRDGYFNKARAHVRSLESTDNEFTALAGQIKIDILVHQKAFTRDVKTLINFDDCYMRALYEHSQLQKNEKKKFNDDKVKQAQQKLILDLLNRSLGYAYNVAPDTKTGRVDVKRLTRDKIRLGVQTVDLRTAWYLLVGYYFTVRDYPAVAEFGAKFATEDPKARNANVCAMYAAEALTQLIKKGAGDDFDQMTDEREQLKNLATLMADRWPGDKAGDLGRYIVAMHLIKKPLTGKDDKEKDVERKKREDEAIKLAGDVARFQLGVERAREKRFLDSIVLLRDIKPAFSNYTLAQYQVALAALELDKDDSVRVKENKPTVLEEENTARARNGQPPLTLGPSKTPFKEVALKSLENIPDVADVSNQEMVLFYLRARTRLGFMYYSSQQYDKMLQLVDKVQPLLGTAKLPEMEKNTFQMQVNSIRLYALYGKTEAASKAGNLEQVAKDLDPFVNDARDNKYPELKEDTRLLNALLGLAFRSNLQTDKITRAKQILDVWKTFQKEGENTIISSVLQSSVANTKKQIDELKKKGDKEKLAKTVNNFSAFLNEVKQEPALTADLLAQCYISIGKYQLAIEQLTKYIEKNPTEPVEKKDAPAEEKEKFKKDQSKYRVVRVMLVRAYRLQGKENKDAKSFELAKKKIDELMINDMAPMKQGWGRRDVNALEEEIALLIDMGDAYGAAFNRANTLLTILSKKMNEAGVKEHYFKTSYHYVYALTQYALDPKNEAKRDVNLARAARFYKKLADTHKNMGGDEHKERWDYFLDKTPEGAKLREAVDKLPKDTKDTK